MVDPGDARRLREERCITFYSGYSGLQEHPEFLDANWIECLIGCRRCQIVCLENRPFKRWVGDDWELSDEETPLLLDKYQDKYQISNRISTRSV